MNFPIKLVVEAMLTPQELRLYNQIKIINARKIVQAEAAAKLL